MSLKVGTSTQGGALGKKLADGVYGKKGHIKSAVQDFEKVLGTWKPDVFLNITIDSGGQFDDEVQVFGQFFREELANGQKGEVVGWGSAGKVDQLLQRFGAYDNLDEASKNIQGNVLPVEAINNLTGTSCYFITFCVGKNPNKDKPMYNNYEYIVPVVENTPEEAEQAYNDILNVLYSDEYAMGKLIAGRDYLESSSGNSGASLSGGSTPGPNRPAGSGHDDLPI